MVSALSVQIWSLFGSFFSNICSVSQLSFRICHDCQSHEHGGHESHDR